MGAHIGYFSRKAARVIGNSGRVIAVEPNPHTLTELRDNIRESGAGVVTVIIRESNVSRVDIIKIDGEGAELFVLKGAHETLVRYHPLLVVEVVEPQLYAMRTTSAAITGYLHSFGYRARHRIGQNVEYGFAGSTSLAAGE